MIEPILRTFRPDSATALLRNTVHPCFLHWTRVRAHNLRVPSCLGNVMRRQKSEASSHKRSKYKKASKMGCKVHLTRDLKQLNQQNELYQITLSKTPKNVIFQKWDAPFFYPKLEKKTEPGGLGGPTDNSCLLYTSPSPRDRG